MAGITSGRLHHNAICLHNNDLPRGAQLSHSLGVLDVEVCAALNWRSMIDDVFISAKSSDYQYANQVYKHLTELGVRAFFSRESLPELGNSDYRKEIDKKLEEVQHMVVVVSSVEHAKSPWVEAEWGFFINEKRSGRKNGNLITVTVGPMQPDELPASLRYYEVIPFSADATGRVARQFAIL